MRIDKISLENFRNYRRLDIDVGPSVNIVYGSNGEGKTNLIEAIYVASCVTSHKTNKDKNLIKFGEDGFSITLNMTDDDGTQIELIDRVVVDGDTTKRTLINNNEQISRISDYIGVCNTVIFAPEDLNIIKGAPSERRRFLNIMISKISPSYFNILGQINRMINQKKETLRSARNDMSNIDAKLDYWDFSLADLSAELIINRYRFIRLLNDVASRYHESISGGKEELKLSYVTIGGCIELLERFLEDNGIVDEFMARGLNKANFDALKAILSKHILDKFLSSRKYDIEKGVPSVGIRKDDIEIYLNNNQTRLYSSQGQQRSAALSMKLAELEIIRRFVSSTPILLLDDVFSELDVDRRKSLIAAIKGTQIFITCTDKEYIEDEISSLAGFGGEVRYFHIKSGSVL